MSTPSNSSRTGQLSLLAEIQRQVGRFCNAEGLRAEADGDTANALLWFTEALSRDAKNADFEVVSRLWLAAHDALRPRPTRTPQWFHWAPVVRAAFSPDGRQIVTGSADQTARLWDAATGRRLSEPHRHDREVKLAAFSPDSRRVLAAAADRTARVWDAQTGKPAGPPLPHPNLLHHAAFHADGGRILTACADGFARVFDAVEGKLLYPPCAHPAKKLVDREPARR